MPDLYPRIVQFIREQPWAITPEKLAVILDLVRIRNQGYRLSPEDIEDRVGTKRSHSTSIFMSRDELHTLAPGESMAAKTKGRREASVIAVLGVYGVITQRADLFSEMSGMTSTERLTERFREAIDDRAVGAIVFDIDSPGGGVYGVQELANEIRASRGRKSITAVSNSLMASAAYWIGSQADEVVMSPSAEAGSIGVYAAHEDISVALEQEGVKVTLMSYGENKTLGNPFEPLSEEGRAEIQARVNDYGAAFDQAVARGRGVKVEDVRSRFGQGLVFCAKAAVDRGLADRIGTLDETLARVAPQESPAARVAREADLDRVRMGRM